MIIRLTDVPEEGKIYSLNRKSGELNEILRDLIQDGPYQAEISIRSLNNRDFELSGSIVTNTGEQCSTCGIEFRFPVKQRFLDIMIPQQTKDRIGKYAKVNHLSDSENNNDGSDVIEYSTQMTFDLGEYLHEIVALAIPFNPKPAPDEKGDCSLCGKAAAVEPFSYNEEMPTEEIKKPFEALKGLKLN